MVEGYFRATDVATPKLQAAKIEDIEGYDDPRNFAEDILNGNEAVFQHQRRR